ncbi:TPA: flippase [Streptococcus suis]|nr:flippase [Streptococcus suis]
MNNSRQRKIGAVLSYFSITVNTVIQLLYTPLLVRMLGQSDYGLFSLVSSIIGYLTVLDLGFGNAIIVYTAKYRTQERYDELRKLHGMFKVVFYIIGIFSGLLGLVLYFNVDSFFAKSMTDVEVQKMRIMMLILTFNLVVTFSFSLYNSIISAYEKFIYQKALAILNSVLKPMLMIPLLFLGYKSIALCVVITLVNIIVLLSNYIFCRYSLKLEIKYQGFDFKLFKKIFSYSIWIFLAVIVDKVNWSVDNFILGAVSGTVAVSIYSIAATLNQLFINLSTAISGVLLPKMSKMIANNASSNQLTDEMIKVGRIQNYVIFLMCSGLILFGKQFINLWVGDGFEESYYVALLLIVPVCFPLIQNIGLSIMQAMNKYKFKSVSTSIMAVFNVIISVILAKKLGAIGAAIGSSIALVVCNIFIINIYYYKELKLDVIRFWKDIFKQVVPFIIPIILILLVMRIWVLNSWISLIVYGSIYTLIYGCVSYLCSMNKYEKDICHKLFYSFIGGKND